MFNIQTKGSSYEEEMKRASRLVALLEKRELKKAQDQHNKQLASAMHIQRFYRGAVGRRRFHSASIVNGVEFIQCVWRIMNARWHPNPKCGLKATRASYELKWAKDTDRRDHARDKNRSVDRVVACNRYEWRRLFPDRLVRTRNQRIVQAAIDIQCAFRSSRSRREAHRLSASRLLALHNKNASLIQAVWAIYHAIIKHIWKEDHDAAVCIQRVARGRIARRTTAIHRIDLKEQEARRRKMSEMVAMREALKTPPTPPQRRKMNRLSVREDGRRQQYRKEKEGLTRKPGYLAKKRSRSRRNSMGRSSMALGENLYAVITTSVAVETSRPLSANPASDL
jgi:hypothetical protein